MFHAGVVAPSSVRLLQLLTPPEEEVEGPPVIEVGVLGSKGFAGLAIPLVPRVCRFGVVERPLLALLAPLALEKLSLLVV